MPLKHSIPLAQAIEMTRRYRTNRENILTEQYREHEILPTCETFDAASIQKLIDQANCVSIRIYYGMDESLGIHAIIVGADSEGRDILPLTASDADGSPEGEIMEDGIRCPKMCPPESPLNGG